MKMHSILFGFLFILSASSQSGVFGLQCQRISLDICQGLGYNMTAFPNLAGDISQLDAELKITKLAPILESECSKHVRFLLCASLFPLCSPDVSRPVTPCKGLCEAVKKECTTNSTVKEFWPEFLQCGSLPQPEKQELCMQIPEDEIKSSLKQQQRLQQPQQQPQQQEQNTKQEPNQEDVKDDQKIGKESIQNGIQLTQDKSQHENPHNSQNSGSDIFWPWHPWKILHNSKTVAIAGETSLSSFSDDERRSCPTNFTRFGDECVAQCNKDAMYTTKQKKITEALILTLSGVCFLLTLFSLVTFWAEPMRFGYPERPVLFLALCYNLLSVCHLERIIFHNPIKEALNAETNTCILSPPCLASYITTSYLTLCAASWWLIFTLCFYLSSSKKWSSEALEKKAGLFHVLAWVSPLGPPISALLWGAVKPFELTGMCVAPGFVEIPALILLLIGLVFTELASKSLQMLQEQLRQTINERQRFSQIRKRVLVFSFVFFTPACLTVILSFFEKIETKLPLCSAIEDSCENPDKVSSLPTLLRLFFHLAGGSLAGMWVWSRKTCESYRNRIISPSGSISSTTIKSASSLSKKINSVNSGKQITAQPLYSGINFHNVPIHSVHSRV